MMNKMTIDDVDIREKRVLMRVDFNVPLTEDGSIRDDLRIRESLPSIRKIVDSQARLILMSHLGRPKGKIVPEMSLKPAAQRLAELLGAAVLMAPDCIGAETAAMVKNLKPGQVLLLENLRFHPQEEKNDGAFSRELASYGDVYINDAFGTAHRAHASTEGVTRFIPVCAAGYLMQKELRYLDQAIADPKRPLVAILGGAKISGKIDVIKSLLPKVDALIIGGGMAYTFFKAMNLEIGTSLLEEQSLDIARQLLESFHHKNVYLPADIVIADTFDNDAAMKTVSRDAIPPDWMGLDIGPKSIKTFSDVILNAGTVIWNGPLGVFEMPNFATGTNAIAHALAKATHNGCITIIGGGDSAAAVKKAGLADKMTHISTGGGASLEFLEGKILPGVAALNDRKN